MPSDSTKCTPYGKECELLIKGNEQAVITSPPEPDFPSSSLRPSMDTLCLSIRESCAPQFLSCLLELGFKVTSNTAARGGSYRRCTKLVHPVTGVSVLVLHSPRYGLVNRPSLLVYLQDVTKDMMQQLSSVASELRVLPNLNRIDIALDFLSEAVTTVKQFLRAHTQLKYARTEPWEYGGTYYISKPRQTHAASVRQYTKIIDGQQVERLELILKSPPLRRQGINWDLSNIAQLDVFQRIRFMRWDIDGLTQGVVNYFKKNGGVSPAMTAEKALVEYLLQIPLMEALFRIKDIGITNYGKHLYPITGFEKWVQSEIERQGLLP